MPQGSPLFTIHGAYRRLCPSRNDSFVAISALKETANQNGYLSSLYSLSELRDLPFHLQEHILDLPQIGPRKLRANRGWRLISFNVFRPSVIPVIESRRPNRSKKNQLLPRVARIGRSWRLAGVAIGRPIAILVAASLAILRTGSIRRAVMALWAEDAVFFF